MTFCLLRLSFVISATGLTRSTPYLRIKQQLMTPLIKLGKRRAAWPAHELAAINTARIAGASFITKSISQAFQRL